MFLLLSKIFLYISLFTPLIVFRKMFFPFVSGKAIFFRASVELSLLFFLVHLIVNRDKNSYKKTYIFKNPIFLSLCLFIFVVFLTSLTGVNPLNSIFSNFERGSGALQLVHYFIFFYLAISLFKTKKDWVNFIKFFLLVSLFVSFYGLGQFSQNPFFMGSAGDRMPATLGNPIYFANYLLFVYFFAFWVIFNEKRKGGKIFWIVYLVFQSVFFFFVCTRSTTLGLTLAIITFLIFNIINSFTKTDLRKLVLCSFLLFLIFISGLIFYFSQSHPFWKKVPCVCRFATAPVSVFEQRKELSQVERQLEYRAQGVNDRLLTWSSALAGFIQKPVLGWGIENFPYVFDKYYSAKHFGREIWFDRAHNLYLEYLTSGGILLFLAFLFVFLAVIYNSLFIIHNSQFKILILSLLVAYLAQGFFNFEDLSTYLALFLFLGLIQYLTINNKQQTTINKQLITDNRHHSPFIIRYSPFTVGLLVVLIFAVLLSLYYFNFPPYKKNILMSKALAYSKSPRPDLAFSVWGEVLSYKSLVGQGEAVKFFLTFTKNFLKNIELNKNHSPSIKKITKKVVFYSDKVYQENSPKLVGVQSLFFLCLGSLSGYNITQDPQILVLVKKRVNQGREISPTRIIFLELQRRIAQIENNKKEEKKIIQQIKFLRPDLQI